MLDLIELIIIFSSARTNPLQCPPRLLNSAVNIHMYFCIRFKWDSSDGPKLPRVLSLFLSSSLTSLAAQKLIVLPSLIECYLLSRTISTQAACSDTAGLQFGGGWVSRSDRSAVQKSDCSLNHRPQRPFKWCDN